MGNQAQSAYDGIKVTETMLEATLVKQTSTGQWYRFRVWTDRIMIVDRREEYRCWQEFDEGWGDNNPDDLVDIRARYLALFRQEAPKNAVKKTLTKAIWGKMYLSANDRSETYRSNPLKDPVTGKRERKRQLDRRGYRALDVASVDHLQNQALIIHRELLLLHKTSDKEIITEAEVSELMTRLRDTGVLKTKQDPFRIFQYYRPALIKAGKLEFHE